MKDTRALFFAQDPNPAPNTGKANPKDAIRSETLWITVGLLSLVIVIGAVVLAVVDRWRKRAATVSRGPLEEVTNFREMYESGEITRSEYETIRNKVSGRTVTVEPRPAEPGKPGGPSEDTTNPPNASPQ